MRGKSHCQLGAFLASTYFPQIPPLYRRAFLLGCIEPDRNPATYLKGSIRAQWLRGHNFENAKNFMTRIARRLEAKPRWGFFDYYTAGKRREWDDYRTAVSDWEIAKYIITY